MIANERERHMVSAPSVKLEFMLHTSAILILEAVFIYLVCFVFIPTC